VQRLPLYAPDTSSCRVDVSDNTNLWGAPPAAERALRTAESASIARYPSLYGGPLRAAILRYLELGESEGVAVVTGCGSDDVIDSTMRAFGSPGDRVACSVPTFSMVDTFARLNGMEVVGIPFATTFDVDAERLVALNAKITYLCTPNNPTGTIASKEAVEYVVANARGVVVLDEAYAEFASESFVELVVRHERLLVTRTFSKAFGLAGLRVGYGVGGAEVVAMVERARGPYKVSSLAERAVLAALEESEDALGWVRDHAQLAVGNRERLEAELQRVGLQPLPSHANFVFVPLRGARMIARKMRDQGVLVRALTGLPRELAELSASDGEALRIGVAPWPVMRTVIDALAVAIA
jgi:histidinol-phosphate aminotransferase